MVLDADTLDLAPRAGALLERLGGDPRFKLELPAAQLEIVVPPLQTVGEAAAALAAARADLAEAAHGIAVLAGAGAHPFAATEGVLSEGERYEALQREYGPIARSPCTTRCAGTCPSSPRSPPTRRSMAARTPG